MIFIPEKEYINEKLILIEEIENNLDGHALYIKRNILDLTKLCIDYFKEIIDKPEPSSERTYKATYPAYISDFKTSDDADGIGRWFFSKIY